MYKTLYAKGFPEKPRNRLENERILTPPSEEVPMFGKCSFAARAFVVFTSLTIMFFYLSPVHAYRICTFKGTVTDHGWRSMTVKSNGQCAEVNVGWRTKYIPNRRPCLGERVAVDFVLEDGYMKATKVVSLSPLPTAAQCYPPPPPSSSECKSVGEEAPTATDSCAAPRAICSAKPPSHVSDPSWTPGSKPVEPKPAERLGGTKKPVPEKKELSKAPVPRPAHEPREEAKEPIPADDKKSKSMTGEVVASSPKSLSLRVVDEGETAEVINIKVGLKTKFIPFRRPAVGEKVRVDYRQENGDKFGYTVQVVQ